MSLQLITGEDGHTALYDTVTETAFGPVFSEPEHATAFLDWAEEHGVKDGDVRRTMTVIDTDMVTSAALAYTDSTLTYGAIVASTADIPRSCICTWTWQHWHWHLDATFIGCPWHGRGT